MLDYAASRRHMLLLPCRHIAAIAIDYYHYFATDAATDTITIVDALIDTPLITLMFPADADAFDHFRALRDAAAAAEIFAISRFSLRHCDAFTPPRYFRCCWISPLPLPLFDAADDCLRYAAIDDFRLRRH